MSKSLALPQEVHDHFRSANNLHKQVQKSLGDATEYALKIGQELLAAKRTMPHGSWESECERLFDGSLRTAQFYMQVTKNLEALPKAQASAILFLEGSLEGVAKAAKKAAKSPPPPTDDLPEEDLESSERGGSFGEPPESPETAPDTETDSEAPSGPGSDPGASEGPQKRCTLCNGTEFVEDGYCATCGGPEKPGTGKCPNCNGSQWSPNFDGSFVCSRCRHPWGEPVGDLDENTKTEPTEAQVAREQIKIWHDAVGKWLVMIDHYRNKWPARIGDEVLATAKLLYESLREWKGKVR